MPRRLVLCTLLLAVLSACSLIKPWHQNGPALQLLAPQYGPVPALYQQKLNFIATGVERQVLVALKIDTSGIKLRALLPTGQSLYSIEYDGQTLSKQNLANVELPADEILAMLQFALWPSSILDETYNASEHWLIEETEKYRLLSYNGKRKLRVDFVSQNTIHLTNYSHQYEVNVETLEYKKL